MGIEVAEHALDSILQQCFVIDRLHVRGLDPVQYFGESPQLFQRQRRFLGRGVQLQRFWRDFRGRLLRPGATVHSQHDGQGQGCGLGETAQVQHV